jgi:hypothetical protein
MAVSNPARLRETLGVLVGLVGDRRHRGRGVAGRADARALVEGSLSSIRSDVQLSRGRLHAAERVAHDDWADYTPSLFLTLQPFFQYPPTRSCPSLAFRAALVVVDDLRRRAALRAAEGARVAGA